MISVSYLSIKYDLKEFVKKIDQTTADMIHIDVMDGRFVEEISKDYNKIYDALKDTNKKLDVHLMVKDAIKYIDMYSELKPEYITFHFEAVNNIQETINYVKSKGIKVGISTKLETEITDLLPYLNEIDLVLIMSVAPGYGSQAFNIEAYNKVDELFKIRKYLQHDFAIEIDGGINDEVYKKLDQVDIKVIGSFIVSSENYQEKIDSLRD